MPEPMLSTLQSKIPVKVQLEGKTVWIGQLAGSTSFESILQDWQQVRSSMGFLSKARVGSGPHWPGGATTLLEAMSDPTVPRFVSRKGLLHVTIFPETRGGGAKDEKYAVRQTQLAKEFLEQGLSLADASAIVDRLLPQAGLPRA